MDYETQEGKTALLVAIDLENVDAISALVKSRADINHQTSKAVTPLVAAARDEKAKSLAALILHGARWSTLTTAQLRTAVFTRLFHSASPIA